MKRLWEELDALGACTREGLDRVLRNEALYLKCLRIFSSQAAAVTMQEALARRDYEDLLFQTHSFKGTTGNLSLTPLFVRYQNIVSELQKHQYEGLQEELSELLQLQEQFCRVIDRAAGFGGKQQGGSFGTADCAEKKTEKGGYSFAPAVL